MADTNYSGQLPLIGRFVKEEWEGATSKIQSIEQETSVREFHKLIDLLSNDLAVIKKRVMHKVF